MHYEMIYPEEKRPTTRLDNHKCVRFDEKANTAHLGTRFSAIGQPSAYVGDKAAKWYCSDELDEFRREAIELANQYFDTMQSNSSGLPAFDIAISKGRRKRKSYNRDIYISRCLFTRGLEYACCYERQRRVGLSRHAILESAVTSDPCILAEFSVRCNAWAADVALQQAQQDAVLAQEEEEQESVS